MTLFKFSLLIFFLVSLYTCSKQDTSLKCILYLLSAVTTVLMRKKPDNQKLNFLLNLTTD